VKALVNSDHGAIRGENVFSKERGIPSESEKKIGP